MYDHFVCQLSNTRLMDANKKYKKNSWMTLINNSTSLSCVHFMAETMKLK